MRYQKNFRSNIILVLLASLMSIWVFGCAKESDKLLQNDAEKTGSNLSKNISIEATGMIRAQKISDIVLDFDVQAEKIYCKKGDLVSKDMPIIQLNIENYKNKITSAENELLSAQLQVDKILGVDMAQKEELRVLLKNLDQKERNLANNADQDMNTLSNDIYVAAENLKTSQKEFAQATHDVQTISISQDVYETIKNRYEANKQALNNLRLSLEKLKQARLDEIEKLKSSISQIEAKSGVFTTFTDGVRDTYDFRLGKIKVEEMKNNLAQMKAKLNKEYLVKDTIICTFATGSIYDIIQNTGLLLSTTQKIVRIADMGEIKVEADIPEESAKHVGVNTIAHIIPVYNRNKKYSGKIESISTIAVKNSSGETNIPVVIKLDTIDSDIRIDGNVDITLDASN